MKSKRVALYARVSTDLQTTQNQLLELRAMAGRSGWTIVAEFVDDGVSGAKGRDKRPQFDALLKGVSRKEFDLVAAWHVDRLGRSLQDLLAFLSEIKAKGVDLYLHQQALDTSTPAGRMVFQMCGVFAEFERGMMQARILAGLARTKAKGTKLGRPRVDEAVEAEIKKLAGGGMGKRKIARTLGIGVGTAQRVLAEASRATAT